MRFAIMWATASVGGDEWGCGRWRGARPGLADAAGGIDAAGVSAASSLAALYAQSPTSHPPAPLAAKLNPFC